MADSDSKTHDAALVRAPHSRFARKVLALALGVLLTIAVVEGGYRIWKSLRGDPYDGVRSEQRLDELVAQLKGVNFAPRESVGTSTQGGIDLSLHPYEGYQMARVWEEEDNPQGYYSSPQAAENYDILLFGGSVAAEFSNYANKVLVPLLEADPHLAGRRIKFHSRACAGHKQPQLAANLDWALSLGVRPDAVVLLDGFNELAVAHENAQYGVHPLFPSWWQIESALSGPLSDPEKLGIAAKIFAVRSSAEELAARAHRFGVMHSAVLGSYVEHEFTSLENRSGALQTELKKVEITRKDDRPLFVRGPPFASDNPSIMRISVQAWTECSRSMQAVCNARHIFFVHILQPAARDKGSKPLTEKEEQVSLQPDVWRSAIERGYPRLRDAGARLAREGVNFHDGSQVFADHHEEIYRDPCHFGIEGCTILGQFIAKAMLESWPKD